MGTVNHDATRRAKTFMGPDPSTSARLTSRFDRRFQVGRKGGAIAQPRCGSRPLPFGPELTTRRDDLSKTDTVTVAAVETGVPTLATERDLMQRFHRMFRVRDIDAPGHLGDRR